MDAFAVFTYRANVCILFLRVSVLAYLHLVWANKAYELEGLSRLKIRM